MFLLQFLFVLVIGFLLNTNVGYVYPLLFKVILGFTLIEYYSFIGGVFL